jgi:photosystem II stability/assembly factor-like uncharacterized protein
VESPSAVCRRSCLAAFLVFCLWGRAPAVAQSPFSFLQWRSIGPVNTSGRVDDIAVARVRGQADAIYVATASGGLFKSANNGISWEPVFDGVDAMMSIGAVAVAPSSPQTVWVGTGEANTRQSSSWGDGVYRSTDGGATWTNAGLRDTRQIGRIVIDPTDPNIVYVAAQGHLWGPNEERGVFLSTDAGRSWRKVLYVDENTGANDLVIDPTDPETLYASTYQRQRRTWGFNGGGPGSAIYKTTDGGTTWNKLTTGLPSGDKGRIGLAMYTSDPRVVYASIEAAPAGSGSTDGPGIYRTLDAGASWEKMSNLNVRPNYYSEIRIDPRDRDHVYTLGSNRGFYFSDDGGKTFTELFSNVHSEDHALWVDPDAPNHMIVGGDGGVSITWDRGRTWDFRRNMPIGQFYEVDVDNKVPFTICGGLQDNGVWCIPSGVRNRNGIADRDAWNIGGGDGFHAHFDPTNPSLVIQESQNGNVAWVNIGTLERQGVRPGSGEPPPPPAPGGRGGRGAALGGRGGGGGGGGRGSGYRWNWDTPIVNSPHDPATWYMGAQVLFRSRDRGSSWTKISPDLTLDIDRDTLKMMGAVVGPTALSRNDGQSNYGSITSIGESPVNAQVVWTGSDDGQVQVTRDGGSTWTNVTSRIPGVPPQTYVSTVLPSRFKGGRIYVTFDGHYMDDYKPYVFVSDDFGATWRSLAAGLPETSINRIREHPRNPRVLVLAHERGAHFSNDGGATWIPLTTSMPTVPVDDAVFQERENALVLGTHGRGIWVLDDAGPLESLTADAMRRDAVLLPAPRAYLMSTFSPQAWYGYGEHFASNPEWNAVLSYYSRDGASGVATIAVKDASGTTIRTLEGPVAKGVNRVVWDLRYAPPVDSANVPAAGGRGGGGGGGGRGAPSGVTVVGFPGGVGGGRGNAPLGPLVLPGRYAVSVRIPGVAAPLTGSVNVEADPLPHMSNADRLARQAVLMRIYSWTKTLGEARVVARALVGQRDSIRADFLGGGTADAGAKADSLNARITRLAADVDRALNAVNGHRAPIEGWSGMPTADQQKALGYAVADARKALTELQSLTGTDIPNAYRQVTGRAWTRVVKAPVPPPGGGN